MGDIDTKNIRKRLLKIIIEAGYQISPDALDFLVSQSMGEGTIEEIIAQADSLNIPTVITRDFLLSSTGKVELAE